MVQSSWLRTGIPYVQLGDLWHSHSWLRFWENEGTRERQKKEGLVSGPPGGMLLAGINEQVLRTQRFAGRSRWPFQQ